MDEKNKFITHMNMKLDNLLAMYESAIIKQKEEIEQLTSRLQESENEKRELQKVLQDNTNKKETSVSPSFDTMNNKVKFNPDSAQIDIIVSSNSIGEMQNLLSAAVRMWKRGDIEKLTYVFEKLNDKPRLLKFENENLNKDVLSLFKSILLKDNIMEQEHDHLVNEVINLGTSLKEAPIAEQIAKFLKMKNSKAFENIVSRNESSTIIKYIRMLMGYKCEIEVKEALKHLLGVEWGFIDASLTKEEFEFFLWYAYLFGLDQELIDKSNVSLQWFTETSKELAFYFYFSKEKHLHSQRYKFNVNQFMNGEVLTSSEKMLVLEKVKKEHEVNSVVSEKSVVYQKPLYVIEESDLNYLNKQYDLMKKRITIPMYKKTNMHQIYFYIETDEIFISQKNDAAFICRKEFEKLLKKNTPLVFKTSKVSYVASDTNLADVEEESSFSWPSTDINTDGNEAKNEEKILNETSELKKLGYQITGISRAQRWRVLEKAVPKLGLKKVVYTISYNVKLRKGQKNGEKKFSYAISEWEHDLAKLKKYFYKQEFKWPTQ